MRKNIHKTIRNYLTLSGKSPFSEWLQGLKDSEARLRILRRLDRIELGNYGDSKSVGDGVYELRFTFGPGYRVYFAEHDNTIVILLCGGNKSTQKQDIKTAKAYWLEFRSRINE